MTSAKGTGNNKGEASMPKPKFHDTHIMLPVALWRRLRKAVTKEYLPSVNAAIVQAVRHWLDGLEKSGK